MTEARRVNQNALICVSTAPLEGTGSRITTSNALTRSLATSSRVASSTAYTSRTLPRRTRGSGSLLWTSTPPSYLNLRRGRRGSRRLNGTHQIRKDAIEKIVHLLRRPTHVRRGVELVAGGSNAEALELRSLRQPVEQLGRTRHALGANDFVQRLAIAAGFHAAHEQSLGGEIRHRRSNVLSDGLFADLEPGSHVSGEHENRISREERL